MICHLCRSETRMLPRGTPDSTKLEIRRRMNFDTLKMIMQIVVKPVPEVITE